MRKSKRERQELTAIMNDRHRRGTIRFMVTPGIRELGHVANLVKAVRRFDSFTEENDPHGEHDFGSLEWYGVRVFWKMDYYDWALEYGENPLSLRCKRVLR
jgi:Protein of unknown function (DUF3768)